MPIIECKALCINMLLVEKIIIYVYIIYIWITSTNKRKLIQGNEYHLPAFKTEFKYDKSERVCERYNSNFSSMLPKK